MSVTVQAPRGTTGTSAGCPYDLLRASVSCPKCGATWPEGGELLTLADVQSSRHQYNHDSPGSLLWQIFRDL
jgi:hypothetical protein